MEPACSTPSPAASPSETLYAILGTESFLVRLSAALFDPNDSKMRKFTQLARTTNPHFHIIYKLFVALLARQIHPDAPLY